MAHGKWWAITSILFCASLAHSQIPTPIRSVTSLPATCNGGTATKASDMVILITAGVGATYICNTPNHWITIAGSGGGNVDPGTGSSQVPNWDPIANKYVPQVKPSYDTRDQGFVCDGTTNNSAAATTFVSLIAGTPVNLQFTQLHCGMNSFLWPANITLDFSTGGSLKTLTDGTTAPGGASFNATGAALGHCESNNTTPTCAMSVTATANDTYALVCMRGFSSGAPSSVVSNIASDIIIPWPGSDPSFVSITLAYMVPNVTAGARTFTLTFPANLVGACTAVPISGLGPTPWLDGAGFVGSNVATTSPMTGAATFQAGSFLLAFGGNNNTSETCTAGAGFTMVPGAGGCSTNTNSNLGVAYQNSSSAGSTTGSININPSPAGHAWSFEVLGVRPSSARNFILGGINNPQSAQIFENATSTSTPGTAGNINFIGNRLPMRVKPEWWGATTSDAVGSTNAPAVNAAIAAALPTNQPAYDKVLDLSGGTYNINAESKWYGTRGSSKAARFEVDCGSGGGLNQTTANLRVVDSQGMAYGRFDNCSFSQSNSSTNALFDLDWNVSIAPTGTLKPQFVDFITPAFVGNGTTDVGMLIAKSGGAAQGSNINFYNPAFQGFTGSCLQIGGDNTGRNAGRFPATNAIQITTYGGDMQACPLYGLSNYAGQLIKVDMTTMENSTASFNQQTGFDMYSQNCIGGQPSIIAIGVRSESRRLAAGCNLDIRDSSTINQAAFPTPGTTQPVGTILMGSTLSDGKYYRVTANTAQFGGVGTPGALELASSGTATTIANTNYHTTGTITLGASCTPGETMTQAVTASTAVLVSTGASGPMWTQAPTGAPNNSNIWTGGTSACQFTPTTVPVQTNYTVNAFIGFQVSTISGTNSGCKGVVTANTATVITVGSWTSAFANATCPAPAAASGYIVEPNWGTQTVSCAAGSTGGTCPTGMTWVDQGENGIEGQSGTGLSGSTLESVDVPGDRIAIGNGSTVVLKNVTTTRNDWANLTGGNAYQVGALLNNKLDVYNRQSGTVGGQISFQNWSLPRLSGGRTYFSGPFADLMGTRVLVWECGDPTGSAGACNDVWLGGRSDATAGADAFRNRVEMGGGIGPAVPLGTDQAGTDFAILGGGSTGAGAAGKILFKISSVAGSSATPNTGTTKAQINASGQIESLLSTGTAPLAVASTTPVANLTLSNHAKVQACGTTSTCSATAQTTAQIVQGSTALVSGSPSAVTITGISPAFTSTATYNCTATEITNPANNLLSVTKVSGSSITITGPNTLTDVVGFICVGN